MDNGLNMNLSLILVKITAQFSAAFPGKKALHFSRGTMMMKTENSSTKMLLQTESHKYNSKFLKPPWLFHIMMGHSHKQFRKYKKQPLLKQAGSLFLILCVVHRAVCALQFVSSLSCVF